MKKVLFLAAMAATFAFVGCEKEMTGTAPVGPEVPDGSVLAQIAFINAQADPAATSQSRAAETWDQTIVNKLSATEAWEKSATSATLMAFAPSGSLLIRRDLTSAEIAGLSTAANVSLVVPNTKVGDVCEFAVVANRAIPSSVNTKTLLLAELDSDATAYNGTFADVSTKAKRTGGFVMSGIKSQAITAGTTAVNLVLKREVAKVGVMCKTTANFSSKYGAATVKISNITLSRSAKSSYLFDQVADNKYAAGGNADSYAQASVLGSDNKTYTNLYYLFEKATAAAGAQVKVVLDATYDADGSAATTTDQVPLTYELELSGAGQGKILRNGSYLLRIAIDGLTGQDVTATVTVANWETLISQDVNLGN